MNYAGFWKRVLAKFIDFLIFLPLVIINIYFFKQNNRTTFLAISLSITVIILLYNIILTYYAGKTLGKIIMKLEVVKTDGQKVSIVNSIAREVFPIISLLIGIVQEYTFLGNMSFVDVIGLIFALVGSFEIFVCLFNHQHKTVHDFIGDTVVIEVN